MLDQTPQSPHEPTPRQNVSRAEFNQLCERFINHMELDNNVRKNWLTAFQAQTQVNDVTLRTLKRLTRTVTFLCVALLFASIANVILWVNLP